LGVNTRCPQCRQGIPLDDINVARDLALCRRCQQTFSFATLQQDTKISQVRMDQPPRGAWFEEGLGVQRAGVSTRSWAALFLVPFTLVWSGGSLGGIFGSQIAMGKFSLVGSLFSLPFLFGTCILVSLSAMALAGKYELRVAHGQAVVFTGVGALGWRRRFAVSELRSTTITSGGTAKNGAPMHRITFDLGQRKVNFASNLSGERRDYLLAACRRMLGR
jgi:hypothetical protein